MSCIFQRNEIIKQLELLESLKVSIYELEYMSKIDVTKENIEKREKKYTSKLYNASLKLQVVIEDLKPLIEKFQELKIIYKNINQEICNHRETEIDWFDQSSDNYGDKQIKVKYCTDCEKTIE
jgi:ABC-type oligopeptide transport system ATPase subunit